METDKKNNICLLGENLSLIKKKLDLFQDNNANKIQNLWNIISFELKYNQERKDTVMNKIIDSLKEKNKKYSKLIYSYTIIYSLENFNEEKENYLKRLLTEIIKICPTTFNQPFLILLGKDESNKNKIINFINREDIQNIGIDKRNISCFISPLNSENSNINGEKIRQKILRIFSYFYQYGDKFKFNENRYILYQENEKKYYSINILTLGKTQVGKSTFINTLLGEKRTKEGGKGFSCTEKHLSYHLDNIPLEIDDIEGFTGEETINEVVQKIKIMQDNILIEKELNIVIYIINYNATTYFDKNEYLIFKQLTEKYDNTQFLFICTKSQEDVEPEIIENIQLSFYEMIQKGIQEESEENMMNRLKFLYYCQKKDIYYEEIKEKIDKNKFNELNFFEKLDLKFKNYEREEKIQEMIGKILENGESLLFVNLIKDKNHTKIFGMKNVSEKLRKALKYIKENNMKFLYDNIKMNEIERNKLKERIKKLEEKLDENSKIKKEDDKSIDLLSTSLIELENLEETDNNYIELINCITQNKIINAQNYAQKLKEINIKRAKKHVKTYKRFGLVFFFGLIPVADLFIESWVKKNVQKEIAEILNDDLINLNNKNIVLSSEEKSFIDIEKYRKDTSDKKANIAKTIVKIAGFSAIYFLEAFFRIGVPLLGTVFGGVTSGLVMNYDINKYLEFYGKRLIYKYLVNLSFDKIEEYLKNNFEI